MTIMAQALQITVPLLVCLSLISRGDGKHGNTISLRVRRMDV
jgi:hypothetical protein